MEVRIARLVNMELPSRRRRGRSQRLLKLWTEGMQSVGVLEEGVRDTVSRRQMICSGDP